MKHKLAYILTLIFGFSSVAIAQQQILPDPNWAICYDQPASTLAEANSMKLETKFDEGMTVSVTNNCVLSPANTFACQFPLPIANQTVGSHTVTFRTGNVEADESVSWGVTNILTYEVTAKRGAPASPLNIKIIKKMSIGGGF